MSLRGQPNKACTLFRHSLQFYNFAPCPHIPLLQVAAPCVRRRGSRGCGSAVGSRSGEASSLGVDQTHHRVVQHHHLRTSWPPPRWWWWRWAGSSLAPCGAAQMVDGLIHAAVTKRTGYEIGKTNCKREKLHACIKHHC